MGGILLTKRPPFSRLKTSWLATYSPSAPLLSFQLTLFLFIYFTPPSDLFRHSLACPCLSRPILPSPGSCLRHSLPFLTIRGFLPIVPHTLVASIHIPAINQPPTKNDIWYTFVLHHFFLFDISLRPPSTIVSPSHLHALFRLWKLWR